MGLVLSSLFSPAPRDTRRYPRPFKYKSNAMNLRYGYKPTRRYNNVLTVPINHSATRRNSVVNYGNLNNSNDLSLFKSAPAATYPQKSHRFTATTPTRVSRMPSPVNNELDGQFGGFNRTRKRGSQKGIVRPLKKSLTLSRSAR